LLTVINIIAFQRKSGKTLLIEDLTKKLSDKGYNICTIKHISEGSFDSTEKDTWRHIQAGASIVIAVTKNEVVRIKKSVKTSFETILKEVPEYIDVVLVEGFKNSNTPKIIVARKKDEVEKLINHIKDAIAVSGPIAEKGNYKQIYGLPVLDSTSLISNIEDIILKQIINNLPNSDCKKCGYESCVQFAKAVIKKEAELNMCINSSPKEVILTVNNKKIQLSTFPQKVLKNTVTGIVKNLKGVERSIDKITIEIGCVS
jgi:molybdopterin-guanine dinucleotide biosynthesis protein B